MNIEEWKSQARRGTLEYAILLILEKKMCYGYEIIKILSNFESLTVTENTVYPLLRRLQKEKYLSAIWKQNSEGVPPRKYYEITENGKEYLNAMDKEWSIIIKSLKSIKKYEGNGE